MPDPFRMLVDIYISKLFIMFIKITIDLFYHVVVSFESTH